ncbi:guanine nucleotide-binding protein-like 1 [Colletes gigas]|uniref:guanine nucleotide-binding protein-like 1 n=1 Tax=Colletes gigas TaxID=935657 RepID=UPI001C9AD3EF|nr:guanine nucleotide-binding protein-like 1 [Colletes gigas]
MPHGTRKKPFSGKAKKQQMKIKKQRLNPTLSGGNHSKNDIDDYTSIGRNKYALKFYAESKKELMERREEARKAISPLSYKDQEVAEDYFPPLIDMPKRPPWNINMSKKELELQEQKYFEEYQNIRRISNISHFELNLETWRQLWRVLEKSDILLFIVDIRYPVLMFPPYLYHYVTNELKKDMILVLNKVDFASPGIVVAWKEYFHETYPKLHILLFTSYPTYNLHGNTEKTQGLQKRRIRGKLKMAAEGAQKLLDICKEIVKDKVDLTSWHEKIQNEMQMEYNLDDIDHKDSVTVTKEDTSYYEHEQYKNGVLTIGCIGTPNVGKSSLMNALMGKKVVSVSRTPGHTKYFQTIFLTKNVCLCDCPGLVFPSTVPKELQILMGSFPIAQVRDPCSTVKFLAERVDLTKLLRLEHPDKDDTWSAMDICEAWAIKRSFLTARTGRPDTYRAANSLLRMALGGAISIFVYPLNWSVNQEKWENHPEVELVRWIQGKNRTEDTDKDSETEKCSTEEDEEEEEEEEEEESNSDNTSSDESKIRHVVNKFEVLSADL